MGGDMAPRGLKGKNKTYKKVEQRILRAVRRLRRKAHFLTLSGLAAEAEVGVATVCRHYGTVEELALIQRGRASGVMAEVSRRAGEGGMGELRWGVTKGEERMNRGGRVKKNEMEIFYQRLLIEFYKNRDVMEALLMLENVEWLRKWLGWMKPVVAREWVKYGEGRADAMFGFYEWMLLEEVLAWKRERYSKDKISVHVRHLVWITKTMPRFYNAMTAGEK